MELQTKLQDSYTIYENIEGKYDIRKNACSESELMNCFSLSGLIDWSSDSVHLYCVFTGFFLIVTIIALFAFIRRRYKRRSGFASYKKGNTKDQSEFELQPWIGRNTGYLLAFDNPYYDVLAAMGLDDDIEEDYYNPLYDDVSMYSDSGENTSEESCHKDLSSMVIRSWC